MIDTRLRVLLVADHTHHGGALHGAGRQLLELTTTLRKHRHVEAHTLVLGSPDPMGSRLVGRGYSLRYLRSSPYDPRIGLQLVRTCRRHRIDVLHVTDFAASTWGRLAGLFLRIPVVVHVRSHHSPQQPKGFPPHAAAAYRLLAPFTARAIAISGSVADFAIERMGFRPGQIEVLHNPLARDSLARPEPDSGARIRSRHALPARARIIGAVTRFHSVKGIHHLLDALPRVLESVPEAHVLLVGEGPEERNLRTLSKQLGVADRVIFAGYREDVQSYYHAFDVSAVPSLEEGFGNVAVEAMASGTPVVASSLGGLKEIIQPEANGLLVPASNSVALAEAIVRVLTDDELAVRLSAGGRARAEDFALDVYVERLVDLYRRTARGDCSPPAGEESE